MSEFYPFYKLVSNNTDFIPRYVTHSDDELRGLKKKAKATALRKASAVSLKTLIQIMKTAECSSMKAYSTIACTNPQSKFNVQCPMLNTHGREDMAIQVRDSDTLKKVFDRLQVNGQKVT